MATYSGLWNQVGGENYSFNKTAKSPNRYHLARLLKTRGLRELSEAMKTIGDDATPASTASVSFTRKQARADTSANVQGGLITMETKQMMGGNLNSAFDESGANTARAIDAQDVTDVQLLTEGGADADRNLNAYPVDASGNGGGGKGPIA